MYVYIASVLAGVVAAAALKRASANKACKKKASVLAVKAKELVHSLPLSLRRSIWYRCWLSVRSAETLLRLYKSCALALAVVIWPF